MDHATWNWVDVGHLLLTAAVFVYAWQSNRASVTNANFKGLEGRVMDANAALDKRTHDDHAELSKCLKGAMASFKDGVERRMDNHASRIKKVETQAETAPSHKDLTAIHERINDIGAQTSETKGCVESMQAMLGRMDQYLRTTGG